MDSERSSALTWVMGAVIAVAVAAQLFEAARPQMAHGSEGAVVQTARAMLDRGDWLVPRNEFGWPQLNRSVLTFWTSAAPMGVFGETLFAARLGAVALMAATFFFIYAFALTLNLGRTAGVLAVILYATFRTVYGAGHTAGEEGVLAFFVTAALYFFARLIFVGGREEWRDAVLAYAATACAVLGAGLGGLPCVILPLVIYVLIPRRQAEPRRFLFWPVGVVVLAVFVLPWYGLMIAWHRDALGQALFPHGLNLDLLAALLDTLRSLIVGPVLLLRDSLPWSLLALVGVLAAFPSLRRDMSERRREMLYLVAWIGGIVLLVACSRMATGRRLLPAMPAVALLIGYILGRALEADVRSKPLGVGIVLVALGALGTAGLCVAAAGGWLLPGAWLGPWAWALALGLLLTAVMAAWLVWAGRVIEALLWTALAALCMNLAGSLILRPAEMRPVALLARDVLSRESQAARVAVVSPLRSARVVAALYSGGAVDEWMEAASTAARIGYVRNFLRDPGRRVIVMDDDLFLALPSDVLEKTKVLSRRVGVARVGLTARAAESAPLRILLPRGQEKAWYVLVREGEGR
jgi:4-amino-4-deoxy-L-arabinose transferase-like glycosyltransferase